MKVIGFSSGVTGRESNVDRIVKAVLERSGGDGEFVKLTDLTYSGCKGCVELCAKPQLCLLKDDLASYYRKIKEADAVVIGSPIYMSDVNGAMITFIERFFGYRHVTVAVGGKPFVAVVCGHRNAAAASEKLRRRLATYRVDVLEVVEYASKVPPCLSCGRHQECSIGGLYGVMGNSAHSVVVTEQMFERRECDPETVQRVNDAGATLAALA